jgi:hypothetical protein
MSIKKKLVVLISFMMQDTPPPSHSHHHHPPTFSGSVSRDNSQDGVRIKPYDKKMSKSVIELDKASKPKTELSR